MDGRIWGPLLDIGIAAKRRQIDSTTVCIERYWEVVSGLSIGANPNPLTLP